MVSKTMGKYNTVDAVYYISPIHCNIGFIDVMRCAIWYHLYSLKNVKNTPPWVFSRFLICANGSKLQNASQIRLRSY